jgi:hypothetical protein
MSGHPPANAPLPLLRPRICLAFVCVLLTSATSCKQHPSSDAFPAKDEVLLTDFVAGKPSATDAYNNLFLYFVQGFKSFQTPARSMVKFPGLPSKNGAVADGMEGFARSAPLWGAWVASGRPAVVTLPGGDSVDLNETFKQGVLSGTNPDSPGYWGHIGDLDQRIVEASDVTLSLWLLRNTVWNQFSPLEKTQVCSWLLQVNGKKIYDNNYHVFIAFINVTLDKLGCPADLALAHQHYESVKKLYRGDGWFSDSPGTVFDYYNAWGFHYQLYWLNQVDPQWDPEFITTARKQFVASYQYLVSPYGVPLWGRSVCYRMAAAAPLVFGSGDEEGDISPGIGRRALDVTWSYFIRNGAVKNGNITQGYCGADPRILDNYSGPASCLWGLRSLIVAFYKPQDSTFWQGKIGRLPVELGSYEVSVGPSKWHAVGDHATGNVTIDNPMGSSKARIQSYNWFRKLESALLRHPFRPENWAVKYGLDKYESAHPFCGCLK